MILKVARGNPFTYHSITLGIPGIEQHKYIHNLEIPFLKLAQLTKTLYTESLKIWANTRLLNKQ